MSHMYMPCIVLGTGNISMNKINVVSNFSPVLQSDGDIQKT